ncbi:MAG: DUF106 domain-containing protein [Candidatus Diapherotrites archaeon]|nr:DUF106 domain-containing protein [Candidatus Diapherotrites archaeon]
MDAMIEIAIVAMAVSCFSLLLQRKFIDKKGMKEAQKRMKEKQAEMKKQNLTPEQQMEAMKDDMEQMMTAMKGTMKHMVVLMIFILPVFWFLGSRYEETTILLGTFSLGWIWWYIIISLITGITLDKVLEKIWR